MNVAMNANLETTLIYAYADTDSEEQVFENVSSEICEVDTGTYALNSVDDHPFECLFILSWKALVYFDICY